MHLPEATPVLDLMDAFRRSKTMFAAVTLGIFDRLPGTAADLAESLAADQGALERLLDGCCGLGLLEKRDGVYANLPVAEAYLRHGSPNRLTGYIEYSNSALWYLWAHLEDAIFEGTPRWKQAFGTEGGIFDAFYRTPEAKREFLAGMHGLGLQASPAVVRVFNLNRFTSLCDLGGATGHLVIAACERYGNMKGTIFDLPSVVDEAQPYVRQSTATERIVIQSGDFFRDPLPEADLYAVGRILHDWGDEKIGRLLEKIFAALPSGGGLLIAEKLLDDDRTGPVAAQMQSLNMLVCTEGRERTEGEYRHLLQSAGFASMEARRTGTYLDAMLALKL